MNFAEEVVKRGSKVPGPAGPQGAVGSPGVPGNAGKDGAPGSTPVSLPSGQNGPTLQGVENPDAYVIAGLVVGTAGAFLNGVGVCILFLRRD